MKTKKERTPEEEKQRKETMTFNRRFAGFKRTIKTKLSEQGGVRLIHLQLDFLKTHPATRLPKPYFNHEQTIQAFEQAISEYEESLQAA